MRKKYPAYGCCCDLEDGDKPDNCVLNNGDGEFACVYTSPINSTKYRTPTQCPHWRKVSDWLKDHKETDNE